MNKKSRSLYILFLIIIVSALAIYYMSIPNPMIVDEPDSSRERMDISLYIQDREIAATRDCGATKKVTYSVPNTDNIADTSLWMLFAEELSRYGLYKSVTVSDGVAKVFLDSSNTPAGNPMSSLSSCESSHLMSVLSDTLKQDQNITSVELYSPEGRIEF